MKKMLIVLMMVCGSANASFLGDIGDWVSGAVEHAATDIGDQAIKNYKEVKKYGE